MGYKFVPRRVLFEKKALDYPLGTELWLRFKEQGIPVDIIPSHNRVTGIPGKTTLEKFSEAKTTLVVGVRKTLDFQGCKPSAHFQLPLSTSCPGKCQYCYLQTTLGKKPYLRIYVNQEEILTRAKKYIDDRKPQITVFEGAATSDPLPVEPFSGALAKTIKFFSREEFGRFRFVTKFTNVDSLLGLEHRGHTRFRFSINPSTVIKAYEQGTPGLDMRIKAAARVSRAGYPLGFIIAPVIFYNNWQEDYLQMLLLLQKELARADSSALTFEIITHRFTKRAKNNILELYPETTLPMVEEDRKVKYGQFGYIKYVYPRELYSQAEAFFHRHISALFPEATIDYLV